MTNASACFIALQTIAEARPTHMIPKLVMGAVINKVMSLPKDSCKMMIDEVQELMSSY